MRSFPSDTVILHLETDHAILKPEPDINVAPRFPVPDAVFDGILNKVLCQHRGNQCVFLIDLLFHRNFIFEFASIPDFLQFQVILNGIYLLFKRYIFFCGIIQDIPYELREP